MSKTVHVIPTNGHWVVARDGRKPSHPFSTKREAIEHATAIVKKQTSGQLVIYGRDGQVKDLRTYGLPPIQDPPGKKSSKIDEAVNKVTRKRLGIEALSPRG
jgi:hypothetical protein